MSDFEASSFRPSLGKPESDVLIVGPLEGYSPQIGILVSMMALTRVQVLRSVSGMSLQDLDFLIDENANTIGAMLLHLAATETFYQLNTFEGIDRESWSDEVKKQWEVPLNLGEPARKTIRGNSLDYYLSILHGIREKTLAEFRRRDDDWLAIIDKGTYQGMNVNNHAKWFHVAEHESSHCGQFKFIKSRLPREH